MNKDLEKECRDHSETISQRDAMEDAFSDAYELVMGREMVWSSMYGIQEALADMDNKTSKNKIFTREQVTAMIDAERTVIMDACYQQAMRHNLDTFYTASETYRNGYMSACEDLQNFIKSRKGANQ